MKKSEYRAYIDSDEWQKKRRRRIDEGGNYCERCHIPRWLAELVYDQDLHVHHKHYRTVGSETFEDLEVLCARCHEIETFGRSALRPPKETHCEVCGSKHYDYRSALCHICQWLTGFENGSEFPNKGFSIIEGPWTHWRPIWELLCEKLSDHFDDYESEVAKEASQWLIDEPKRRRARMEASMEEFLKGKKK